MRHSRIVQQAAKGFQSDASLADVLMPVELRSPLSLGVVAVPDVNIFQPHRAVELIDGVGESCFADDVVARNVRVTGIDASAGRHEVRQQVQQLGNLLEVSSEREFRSGGVLDENAQIVSCEIETSLSASDNVADDLPWTSNSENDADSPVSWS